MKFLKKPAMVTASGTIPHHHFTDSEFTGTFFSCYLSKFTKLLRAWKRRFDYMNLKIAGHRPVSNRRISVIDWVPLVKAGFSPETVSENNQMDFQNSTDHWLHGQSVLCVGGRIKLYPEYHRLIKNCGGCFIAFHGNSHDNFEDLPRFLKQADMIICPVDCVNHEAFFTVKHYCKYSGTPCALLERSEIKNFEAGIRMLAGLTVSG